MHRADPMRRWTVQSYRYTFTTQELTVAGYVFLYDVRDGDHIGLLSWLNGQPTLVQLRRVKGPIQVKLNSPPAGWQE